jgi:hypothetical protein
LLSALLTEKAAQYYLLARQYRKFSLHIVLAGHKFNACGSTSTIDHSSICFAAAMILYDTTEWSTVKSKLWRALADRLKVVIHNSTSSRIALLLLLQILNAVTSKKEKSFHGATALNDAMRVYQELISDKSWGGGHLTIPVGWESMNTRDILLDKTTYVEHQQEEMTSPTLFNSLDPENIIHLINSSSPTSSSTLHEEKKGYSMTTTTTNITTTVIEDLRLPEIFMESVVLMTPLNGSSSMIPYGVQHSSKILQIELLKSFLEIEKTFEKVSLPLLTPTTSGGGGGGGGGGGFYDYSSLLEICADKLVLADSNIREGNGNNSFRIPLSGSGNSTSGGNALFIPLGEKVVINLQFYNPLPIDLSLKDLQIIMNQTDSFDVLGIDLMIPSGMIQEVKLMATPLSLGTFHVDSASWYLTNSSTIDDDHDSRHSSRHTSHNRLQILQHIYKKGLLLQKTLIQRSHHQRALDTTLTFNVIETSPLLRMEIGQEMENIEILNGEIIQSTLTLYNEGSAMTKNIELICNYPFSAYEYFILPSESGDGDGDDKNENDKNERNLMKLYYPSERGTQTIHFLPFIGQSCTTIRLPNEIFLHPGESIQFKIWFRFHHLGKLQISFLSSYQSAQPSDRLPSRNSFISFHVSSF